MKLIIDTDSNILSCENKGKVETYDLYSKKAFEIVSQQWVRIGWDQKYSYTFSWMGRPVIQLPEDMIRMQEVIYRIQPDVIIETGVAHGGSLIYYASLFKGMGKASRVIGVDIEIREHNRKAIEAHELSPYITLIEGDSASEKVVSNVKSLINKDEVVLVILDSCHTKNHVLKELDAYHDLVSVDSYIVATDGIMYDLEDSPRGEKGWATDNPMHAAKEFSSAHSNYKVEQPIWDYNESDLSENITHWPGAYLKRIS
jgi:cephalosporin hydroxylase